MIDCRDIEDLFVRHRPRIHRAIRKRLTQCRWGFVEEDVDELSQEVFVRLLERVGRYGIPDDIVGYAVKAGFAVATDHVRRKIRKARKQEWLVGDFHDELSPAYESNVENDIFLHELLCAAARTETERLTFVYRYLLGYTLAELAALQRRGCRTYERATASIVARARRIV